MIRQIGNRTFAPQNPIANADSRMIHAPGTNPNRSDLEIHRVEVFELDLSGQIVERDRKKGRRHLALQDFAEPAIRAIVAENANLVLVAIGRKKKGEPHDVVPVKMSN